MDTPELVKRKNKPKKQWSVAEEDFLLDLWTRKIEEFRSTRKVDHLLQEMAVLFKRHGSTFTILEIKTKMHNLKNKYRKEKQQAEATGEPSDWVLFDKLYRLLEVSSDEIAMEISFVDESRSQQFNFEEVLPIDNDYKLPIVNEPGSPPYDPPSPAAFDDSASSSKVVFHKPTNGNLPKPTKALSAAARQDRRRKRNSIIDSILTEYRKTNKAIIQERLDIRKVDTEMLVIEKQRNEILKEFVTNAKMFQDNVTIMLNKMN